MRAAGASGYLRKDRLHEELAPALRALAAGGTWWGAGAGARG
jgi:DNA-binding NarL/FixJ family response regulator